MNKPAQHQLRRSFAPVSQADNQKKDKILKNIAAFRLFSQQIGKTKFKTAQEIVGWMGAMQAQDYSMVKWAVGLRLPNSTDRAMESAIHNGEILRTHLLRPTWHLVSAEDIRWMHAEP